MLTDKFYCTYCGKECSPVIEDDGIGNYEYAGSKGVHHDYYVVSDCCGEAVEDECKNPVGILDCKEKV